MTPAAQQALRRTMEIHSNTTRFALACNLSSKIIEPIQSRCAVVRFRRLTSDQVATRLKSVLEAEKIDYDQSGVDAAVFTADGDMRIALNNVQSTFNGFGCVNAENLNRVCDQPQPTVAAEFLALCLKKEIDPALNTIMTLVDQGYSVVDVVQTVFRVARSMKIDKEITKLNMLREIGLTQKRSAEGVSSPLQLAALTSRLCQA